MGTKRLSEDVSGSPYRITRGELPGCWNANIPVGADVPIGPQLTARVPSERADEDIGPYGGRVSDRPPREIQRV
ncbi:MAG: hypothetical protein K2O45_03600 [Oscillospiraceae bacterium]|nr:hypothetical protein [Oscillospiraceae bacterium]